MYIYTVLWKYTQFDKNVEKNTDIKNDIRPLYVR